LPWPDSGRIRQCGNLRLIAKNGAIDELSDDSGPSQRQQNNHICSILAPQLLLVVAISPIIKRVSIFTFKYSQLRQGITTAKSVDLDSFSISVERPSQFFGNLTPKSKTRAVTPSAGENVGAADVFPGC
jgi:hypothetical protein